MPLPRFPVEGGCRCGALRVRVAARPLFTSACHCRGCQRMTAGPYSLSVAVPDDGFEAVGEAVPGGADHALGHRFCPSCLSWTWTKHPMMTGFVNLRATMLDDPSWTAPFLETCTAERLPFAATGAPRLYPRFPPAEDFPGLLADYAAWALTR